MNVMRRISDKSRELAARVPAPIKTLPQTMLARVRSMSLAQRIWAGAAAIVLLLLLALAWPRPMAVDAAVIDVGVVTREVVDEGRTRIPEVYEISAPVGGEVQRIDLEPGDRVTAGQVVATILPADPALLDARVAAEARAAVASAQAALSAAQADLGLAARDQERVSLLYERGFASQAAMDAANASLRAARSSVNARAADVERARAAAGRPAERARTPVAVRSPVDGDVLRLMQESAAVVPAGALLMEIGDASSLEIIAEFLSQDAVLINAGAPAFVESWGREEPIPARVVRIEPFARTEISALGVEEQRVNVIAHLLEAAPAAALGHGYRVDLRVIVSQQDNILRVPVDALVRDGDGWAVFRIEGGRARWSPVEVGEGGERYRAVRSGLRRGDRVVLFPGDSLEDGARVRANTR